MSTVASAIDVELEEEEEEEEDDEYFFRSGPVFPDAPRSSSSRFFSASGPCSSPLPLDSSDLSLLLPFPLPTSSNPSPPPHSPHSIANGREELVQDLADELARQGRLEEEKKEEEEEIGRMKEEKASLSVQSPKLAPPPPLLPPSDGDRDEIISDLLSDSGEVEGKVWKEKEEALVEMEREEELEEEKREEREEGEEGEDGEDGEEGEEREKKRVRGLPDDPSSSEPDPKKPRLWIQLPIAPQAAPFSEEDEMNLF